MGEGEAALAGNLLKIAALDGFEAMDHKVLLPKRDVSGARPGKTESA